MTTEQRLYLSIKAFSSIICKEQQPGDTDTALGLMTTNGSRSWMNMINIGSTLTGEAWSTTDKPNEDWNHAWGAAPGNLIPRYVLGLRPLAAGYGQILIQPQLGTALSFAQGTIPTIRGPVSILASNAPGQFQLLMNIPGNVTAMVMLPATNATAILDGAVIVGALSTDSLHMVVSGADHVTLVTRREYAMTVVEVIRQVVAKAHAQKLGAKRRHALP